MVFTFPYIHLAEAADGSVPVQNDPTRVDHLNAIIREVAKEKGADVLDLNSYLSPVHDQFQTSATSTPTGGCSSTAATTSAARAH